MIQELTEDQLIQLLQQQPSPFSQCNYSPVSGRRAWGEPRGRPRGSG
uniref:DAPB1 n=1 Tax=Arundo donax TaxID=35708 RepID=A0A0A9GCS9_ARUDO